MATVATKPMTAEEFYDWSMRPENRGKNCELERGEIVEMSRPGKKHGFVCANVARILGNFTFARKRGYVCANDTGTVVERDPDTVRGPDVLLFEDATQYEDVEIKYGDKPPLLAVEVLSPNDSPSKVLERVNEQLAFGTQAVWVIDPDAKSVTVYLPGQPPKVFHEHEEMTGEPVLPDFKCRVAEFFALPGQ